jgi:hypothetical protein
MQNAHWIVTGALALIGVLAYVFKAGQWTQERISRDERFAELKERFDKHVEEDTKWKTEANSKINLHDNRLVRVEADRRIVIFPRRNQAGHADESGE